MDAQRQHAPSRLPFFPIVFFAVVMGLSGLTLAWKSVAGNIAPDIYQWLGAITTVIALIVCALYFLKTVLHRDAVRAEQNHPVMLNFFPAFSISLLLLSAIWQSTPSLALPLWGLGSGVQLLLTLYVLSRWIYDQHFQITHVNPAWFIPIVGNIIAPITGSQLGFIELSWFFFSIGIVFWLVILTIVLNRLFFHEPLPLPMTPMLFILLAPPSIAFVSYTSLIDGIDHFARVLYYVALFIGLFLLVSIPRFIRVPFSLSSWGYSFPSAALTLATSKMATLIASPFLLSLSYALLLGVTLLIALLLIKTIKGLLNHTIISAESK
ncbi:C4-dicarboxylate ABC transporter [Vibrio sp. SM6]|uniref:C4-dicarboxylate ABC transporter n=2 Tax=Vibrio agarilyticus TaxID=2726741 RepID=A0A7X8YGL0_9VIBR|nr:C4-dicarboxylate ABC transporter [Vibrio agarilyticus]